MKSTIANIIQDRWGRKRWVAAMLIFVGWLNISLLLGAYPEGVIASGFLVMIVLRTVLVENSPSTLRIYSQLPVCASDMPRAELVVTLASAAILYLPPALFAQIFEGGSMDAVAMRVRTAICGASSTAVAGCILQLAVIGLHRISFTEEATDRLARTCIFLFIFGIYPFFPKSVNGYHILPALSAPGTGGTIILLLVTCGLIALTWNLSPSLVEKFRSPVQGSNRTHSDFASAGAFDSTHLSRWRIAGHFYLTPACAALVLLGLSAASRFASSGIQNGVFMASLFGGFWMIGKYGEDSADLMRIYRSLPISAGKIAWLCCYSKILGAATLAGAWLIWRGPSASVRDAFIAACVLGAVYSSNAICYSLSAGWNSTISSAVGGAISLLLTLPIFAPLILRLAPSRSIGIPDPTLPWIVAYVFITAALTIYAPFFLRDILESRSEPYRLRASGTR